MKYSHIKKGIFLARPNRFIAHVEIDGQEEVCHVKNTGRCKELLIPGACVYVQQASNANRKTKYDLIAVEKEDMLINIDSQIPNAVFAEWAAQGNLWKDIAYIKREYTYGSSRLDFYVETKLEKILVEVKGVTLEENGVAKFPDAPTERGIKHVMELCKSIDKGYKGYLIFIIQMDSVRYFTPNNKTHKAFGEALKTAQQKGVQLLAFSCAVTKDSIQIKERVKIKL